MKLVVLLAIAFLSYYVLAEEESTLDKDEEDCIKELKLNREEILKLDALRFPPDDNAQFNSFVVCASKKKGLMSSNGEILFDAFETLLTSAPKLKDLTKIQLAAYKNIMNTIITACKTTPLVSDPAKNMISVRNCFFNQLEVTKKSIT